MRNEYPEDNGNSLRLKILKDYIKLCEEFGEEQTVLKFREFVFVVLANQELRNKILKGKGK